MEKPQATAVVAAMQDRARLDWVLARGKDEMPNLLLSWLWFRRYILAYPECCTRQEAQCHILRAEGRSKWAVTESDYLALLRGQSLDHPWIKDPFRVPGLPGTPSLVPGLPGILCHVPGLPGTLCSILGSLPHQPGPLGPLLLVLGPLGPYTSPTLTPSSPLLVQMPPHQHDSPPGLLLLS